MPLHIYWKIFSNVTLSGNPIFHSRVIFDKV